IGLIVVFCIVACKKNYSLIGDVSIDEMQLPKIAVAEVINITQSSAQIVTQIESNGGGRIRVSGICWTEESREPTIEDNNTDNGYTEGKFTTLISGIDISRTYYVRPYARNSKGMVYGETIEFTTTAPLHEVNTVSAEDITQSSVTVSAEIVEYGFTVIERGIVWSIESEDPTVSDNKKVYIGNNDLFTLDIDGLEPGTVYKVRGYAMNNTGV